MKQVLTIAIILFIFGCDDLINKAARDTSDSVPDYTVTAANKSIVVTMDDNSSFESYKIFWRLVPQGTGQDDVAALIKNENIFTEPNWSRTDFIWRGAITDNGYAIENLTPFENYVIAVVGYDKNGFASTAHYYGSDPNSKNHLTGVQFVTPVNFDTPSAPEGFTAAYNSEGDIIISNLNVPGYRSYDIQWRREGEGWTTVTVNYEISGPYVHIIEEVNSWENTYIRVRAYCVDSEENKIYGEWSQVYSVPSSSSLNIDKPTIAWRHTGDYKARITLNLSEYDVPDGAVDVKVDGVLYRDQYYYKYYQYTKYDETTTEYTDTINRAWTTIGSNTQIDLTGDLTTKIISGAGTTYVTFYYLNAVYIFTISFRNSNGEVITSGDFTTNLGDAPTI